MAETNNEQVDMETSVSEVYELGFHIIPTVAEDTVGDVFTQIKDIIEKAGGAFVSEQYPQMTPLAYTVVQKKETGHLKYDHAYFGWIKFDAPSDTVESISSQVDVLDTVVRSLMVKTLRDHTLIGDAIFQEDKREREEDAGEVSEEELDKSIEELVGDDEKKSDDSAEESEIDKKIEEAGDTATSDEQKGDEEDEEKSS